MLSLALAVVTAPVVLSLTLAVVIASVVLLLTLAVVIASVVTAGADVSAGSVTTGFSEPVTKALTVTL